MKPLFSLLVVLITFGCMSCTTTKEINPPEKPKTFDTKAEFTVNVYMRSSFLDSLETQKTLGNLSSVSVSDEVPEKVVLQGTKMAVDALEATALGAEQDSERISVLEANFCVFTEALNRFAEAGLIKSQSMYSRHYAEKGHFYVYTIEAQESVLRELKAISEDRFMQLIKVKDESHRTKILKAAFSELNRKRLKQVGEVKNKPYIILKGNVNRVKHFVSLYK